MTDDVSAAKARMKPIITPSPPCGHNYIHQGIKYTVDDYNLPGGGARCRRYYDAYFCTRCCKLKLVELGVTDNTYESVKFNATPAPYKHEMTDMGC
jgi:hypothetical protein